MVSIRMYREVCGCSLLFVRQETPFNSFLHILKLIIGLKFNLNLIKLKMYLYSFVMLTFRKLYIDEVRSF